MNEEQIIQAAMRLLGKRPKTLTPAALEARRKNGAKGGRPPKRREPVTVRFHDRSSVQCPSVEDAIREIKNLYRLSRVWKAEAGSEIFVYDSLITLRDDQTGSLAIAVIEN